MCVSLNDGCAKWSDRSHNYTVGWKRGHRPRIRLCVCDTHTHLEFSATESETVLTLGLIRFCCGHGEL